MSSRIPLLIDRVRQKWRRVVAVRSARRNVVIEPRNPVISFTFDDFPVSAATVGGKILEQHGLRGTYYASLGLMGTAAPTGRIFSHEELAMLIASGHELGCHTYSHYHAWETPPDVFERSILENARALHSVFPTSYFRTISYPISCPHPRIKRCCAKYFAACRGGGQTNNSGEIDLNHLQSFFLEKRRDNVGVIKQSIDANREESGWLIFSTHDVCDHPTRFGCTPAFFEEIVAYAVQSGATIIPVAEALARLVPAVPTHHDVSSPSS